MVGQAKQNTTTVELAVDHHGGSGEARDDHDRAENHHDEAARMILEDSKTATVTNRIG